MDGCERTLSDQLIQHPTKTTISFAGEAAVLGATAVVQGFVSPINPTEPRKAHVYVYNNIFFSYAADT